MTTGSGWPCPLCGEPLDSVEMLTIHVSNHEREDAKKRAWEEKRIAIGRRYGDDHEEKETTRATFPGKVE